MTNLSSCCNATVSVENGGGTTHWHVCEKCKKACDIAPSLAESHTITGGPDLTYNSPPIFKDINSPVGNDSEKDANKLLDAVARIALALQKVDPSLHADFQFILQDRKDSYDRGYAQGVADVSDSLNNKIDVLKEDWQLMRRYIKGRAKSIPNAPFDPEAERIIQALQYSDSPLDL